MKNQEINYEQENLILQERKIKALEKIASTIDSLTIWFEEVDKDAWDQRLQWYLAEFHKKIVGDPTDSE